MRTAHARAIDTLEPPHFAFCLRNGWRGVLIQLPSLGLGKMSFSQSGDDQGLLAAERTTNLNLVSNAQKPMRFAALVVDLDLSAVTGSLGLRASFEEASNIQPNIEANGSFFRSNFSHLHV